VVLIGGLVLKGVVLIGGLVLIGGVLLEELL